MEDVVISWKTLKKQLLARIKPSMVLNPFNEIIRDDGKSLGEIIEENDYVAAGITLKYIASQVKARYPLWETHKENQNKSIALSSVFIPHGVAHDEGLEDDEQINEPLINVDEEEFPQKQTTLISLRNLFAGALCMAVVTILYKKYVSSANESLSTPTESDNSKTKQPA